jgi:hypothetical protein
LSWMKEESKDMVKWYCWRKRKRYWCKIRNNESCLQKRNWMVKPTLFSKLGNKIYIQVRVQISATVMFTL